MVLETAGADPYVPVDVTTAKASVLKRLLERDAAKHSIGDP